MSKSWSEVIENIDLSTKPLREPRKLSCDEITDLKEKCNPIPCFAQTKCGGCKALKRKYDCLECNFYKPIRDQELDQERVLKRLKSLDKATRLGIAEKYQIKGIV